MARVKLSEVVRSTKRIVAGAAASPALHMACRKREHVCIGFVRAR